MAENKEQAAFRASAKGFLFSLTVLCLAGVAVWFGYMQFFTKGLEHLPAKVCEGTVERETVVDVLPHARSAEEGSDQHNSGDNLTFYCHVVTSGDSSLWGRAQIRPVSKDKWLASYRDSGGDNRIIRVSVNGIEAVAQLDPENTTAGVYVPCVPPVVPSYNTPEAYAVITEVSVGGDTKATGGALRQALTDVAYRLTEHAYELAECKDSRNFPEDLPRYKDD
ncbi:hypothetical protein ABZ092_38630 [Streptomyces bobili]|uniref:hypothetical protein n=1 Tax=Streptomyces bobili TaxID=67280 RepID=UPI0033BB8277